MEFALSTDQIAFRESACRLLEKVSPLDAVRKFASGDTSVATQIADKLDVMGVKEMLAPEEAGGLGLGLLDAALVQEMVGSFVTPCNSMSTMLAVIGVTEGGSIEQRSRWISKITSSEVRFGVAITERVGAREGAGVQSVEGRLSGKAMFAIDARDATHLIVCDISGRLHIVEALAAGLTRQALATIDKTREFSELKFADVAAEQLTSENSPGRAADAMVRAGRLLVAADTLGAAQAMLDKAVAYSLERKQFNRVIGSFQAVKHLCAEMAAQIEPARALVWHAAHAVDEGLDEAELMICLAKAHLADVGTFVARTATEVHGGMGFTELVGLHYWFKRIGVNRQLFGGPEKVREDAARLQGWGQAG